MKIFTPAQMREFDRAATEQYSLPSIVLMENAALRVIEFLQMQFAPLAEKRIVILCGKGQNGGDGLAVARHLTIAGCRPKVFLLASPDDYKGDAKTNYDAARQAAIEMQALQIETLEDELARADLVLDALLGTGFHG